jgi:hypothetical protein
MTDHDIEDLLARYRPADPPPDLRARVVLPPARGRGGWKWLVAAAALLIVSIAAQWGAAGIRERLRPPPTLEASEQEIASLQDFLPADDRSIRAFQLITSIDRERRQIEQARETEPTIWP